MARACTPKFLVSRILAKVAELLCELVKRRQSCGSLDTLQAGFRVQLL